MTRRLSILLLLLAFSWVGEPAYALWTLASDHACCLPKPAAAAPSCHGTAHHGAAGASFAAGHSHSGCTHDCCTRQRTANSFAIARQTVAAETTESTEIVVHANAEFSPNARWSSLSERGPPILA